MSLRDGFTFPGLSSRVIFGHGTLRQVGPEVARLKPKFYPIPDDGPVGQLLNSLGRHPYRPAHLHCIISAPGYETLVTHIFAPDDPCINSDAVFGVKASLMARFQPMEAGEGFDRPFFKVEHDFVLAPTK